MNDWGTRERPTKVKDDLYDVRELLLKKAAELDNHVHFEAAMKPHEQKLQDEIDDLTAKIDTKEKNVADLEQRIEREKKRHNYATQLAEDDNPADLISKIEELEERFQSLLAEKAKYMKKIPEAA